MNGEDQLIRKIARAVPSQIGRGAHDGGLALGIGDDAAILASRPGDAWVVSCDSFIEGVHFLANVHPADSVGYKSLVRAVSDLAAMGAAPRFFFLALALPAGRTGRWLDEFLRGMRRAARSLDMRLAGGDTTTGRVVSISLTVVGLFARRAGRNAAHPVTRSGARPGDRIYVTGRLGRAQLGLELLRRGRLKDRRFAPLLQQHLYPRIRVALACWLARNRVPSAMIDLSDGLSSDLSRLCRASNVGARLWADRIPSVSLPSAVSKLPRLRKLNPLQMALHGGDDYELLFTVPARKEKRLRAAPQFSEFTCIGEITHGRRILLIGSNGRATPLEPAGWDPFRK